VLQNRQYMNHSESVSLVLTLDLPQTTLQHTATHCNTLQHTATHCNILHHTAPHCTTLHHTAPHCTTLHHTAPHCTTLQQHIRFTSNQSSRPCTVAQYPQQKRARSLGKSRQTSFKNAFLGHFPRFPFRNYLHPALNGTKSHCFRAAKVDEQLNAHRLARSDFFYIALYLHI